jgi:hypothetical protein
MRSSGDFGRSGRDRWFQLRRGVDGELREFFFAVRIVLSPEIHSIARCNQEEGRLAQDFEVGRWPFTFGEKQRLTVVAVRDETTARSDTSVAAGLHLSLTWFELGRLAETVMFQKQSRCALELLPTSA